MADLIINGYDAFEEWGVKMGDGFLDNLGGFVPMKAYIENSSRLEHGKRVMVKNARVDSREVTLGFTIEGENPGDFILKKKSFQAELMKGNVNVQVPSRGELCYRLVYLRGMSYAQSIDGCFCKVSVKFDEPNPMNRVP